jgi:hypothetical protein
MKNQMCLNDYRVKELEITEKKSIEGGLAWWVAIGVGIAIGAANEIIKDWDNFKAGLAGKPEIKK